MIDFLEFIERAFKGEQLIFLLICFLFLIVWAYGLRTNQRIVKETLGFNETKGHTLGFLYFIEYGWPGTRIRPVPYPPRDEGNETETAAEKEKAKGE